MKITCPHCGLVGKIGEDKLKASSGSVRCPRCHKAFSPVDEKPGAGKSPGARTAPAGTKPAKKEPVLFGARSGEDIPFTKIMEASDLMSENDVSVQLGDTGPIDIDVEAGAEEIIPLGEDDIISDGLAADDAQLWTEEAPLEELPIEVSAPRVPGDIPDLPPAPAMDAEPTAQPEKPRRGAFGLFGGGKKHPAVAEPSGAARPTPRGAGLRKGFVFFLLIVVALWGGYRFLSTYWPPYAQEKQFLTDSRALFDKYHELRVYLQVGMPDPVFATKVAEAAYVWEVYREKHESVYRKDPLFSSLMIMGRLFLTVKELLDRDMYPDNYLGLEWGEGFPFATKEEFVNAMVASIPVCIAATEENFVFSKKILDHTGNLTFISMTAADILKKPVGPSRSDYAADLKRANKTFTTLDTQMPVLAKAVADVRGIVNNTSGK